MLSNLLLPVLLLGSPAAAAPPPSVTVAFATAEGFKELLAEYEAAVAAWRSSIDATEDKTARAELRRNHPAKAYWERFEALSKGGDGESTLWLAQNLRDKGLKASERGPIATAYFDTLFATHTEAAWFGSAVAALMKEDKVEDAAKAAMLRKAMGASAVTTKAPAMFGLGQLLYGAEATKAEGQTLLETVSKDYPKTAWGTLAKAMFITDADLEVGKPAPDFYGESIDGFGFNLSDYRGKVVLIDFYGFW